MAGLLDQPFVGYPQLARRRAMPNTDAEMTQGLLRGASYYPYDLLGAPIDVMNMALTPFGFGSRSPVGGSDYLQSLAQKAGLSLPKTDSNSENVGRIAASLINPAAAARAVGRVIEPTLQSLAPTAGRMAEDYLRQIGAINNIVPSDGVSRVNQNISASLPTAQPLMSPFVPGVKSGEEMIVQHNLTSKNLYGVEKLGGLPVPSLAISKLQNPLESFGDITLIGTKEMVIPSKNNPVFRSDAYTKRSPNIIYDFNQKSQNNLTEIFSDLKGLPTYDRDIYNLVDDFSRRSENNLLQAKFLKQKGILPDPAEYTEKYMFNSDVNSLRRQNQAEYEDWLINFDSNLKNEGILVKEKIFKGYTQDGNRKYAEANLENIVKEMQGGASSEGWNYGVGNLRALATPKFKKFDDVTKDREKLVSAENFNAIRKQTDNVYFDILTRLKETDKNYSAEDALLEVVESKNINALDRVYKDISKELKADIGLFIKNIQTMPTEYFEIKPQRAVGLNEFAGAVIPNDISARALSILDRAGITDVYKYSSPEERKNLLQNFGKEMFVSIPAIPLGVGLLGNED